MVVWLVWVVLKGGQAASILGISQLVLLLLLLFLPFRHSHDLIRAGLVGRMIKQCVNVVHKQGVEQLSDLLLVRKIQRSVKRDPSRTTISPLELQIRFLSSVERLVIGHLPDALQMHRPNLDDVPNLFALQDPVSPASSHASHIE